MTGIVRIKRGNSRDFTHTLANGGTAPTPFELAGSTSTVTVTDGSGTVVLVQTLVVDAFGSPLVSDGLAIGPGGSSAGVVIQTLTNVETLAFPVGRLTWNYEITGTDGNTEQASCGIWDVYTVDVCPAGTGLTRRELRRRIADRMGDLLVMEATDASPSTSTFVDVLNISGGADNLQGRMLSVANGLNAGHVARVISSSESMNQLTFTPAAPTTFAVGDEIELVNERSRGFTIPEYNRAINNAINDAFPNAVADIAYPVSGDFALDTPFITVPAEMVAVYEVSWQSTFNDSWITLKYGTYSGWTVDPTDGTITVRGLPSSLADGTAVRLRGYARHPVLAYDTDETSLLPEWIVARACYHLALGGVDRDNSRGTTVLQFQRESEGLMRKVRTPRDPYTQKVGA